MSHRLLSRVRGGHRPPLPFYPADNIDLGCCVREHPPGKHRSPFRHKGRLWRRMAAPAHALRGGGKCLVRFNGTLIDSMGPLAAHPALASPNPSALSLPLQGATMKDGIANNSTASISQARKAVEQLKMEACMDRIKVSASGSSQHGRVLSLNSRQWILSRD